MSASGAMLLSIIGCYFAWSTTGFTLGRVIIIIKRLRRLVFLRDKCARFIVLLVTTSNLAIDMMHN